MAVELLSYFPGLLPEGADQSTPLVSQYPDALGFRQYAMVNLDYLLTAERRFFLLWFFCC